MSGWKRSAFIQPEKFVWKRISADRPSSATVIDFDVQVLGAYAASPVNVPSMTRRERRQYTQATSDFGVRVRGVRLVDPDGPSRRAP